MTAAVAIALLHFQYLSPGFYGLSFWINVVVTALCALTIFQRRKRPGLVAAAALVDTLLTPTASLLPFAGYALMRHGGKDRFGRVMMTAGLLAAYILTRLLPVTPPLSLRTAFPVTECLLAATLGALARRQAAIWENAVVRATSLAVKIDHVVDVSLMEERNRLAHEMHDGLGHELAVVLLQAAAARAHAHSPAAVHTHTAHIEEAARKAMQRLQETLALLREPPGSGTLPGPDVSGNYDSLLRSLTRHAEALGVHVHSEVSGTPVPLPPAIQDACVRTCREGLTNAVKYAPDAPITLRLDFTDDSVAISVENRPGTGPLRSLGSSGLGLRGLRQLAESLGGTFAAAPLADNGFLITARYPLPRPAEPTF